MKTIAEVENIIKNLKPATAEEAAISELNRRKPGYRWEGGSQYGRFVKLNTPVGAPSRSYGEDVHVW